VEEHFRPEQFAQQVFPIRYSGFYCPILFFFSHLHTSFQESPEFITEKQYKQDKVQPQQQQRYPDTPGHFDAGRFVFFIDFMDLVPPSADHAADPHTKDRLNSYHT
jgi:hypothetical protein